MPLTDTACHLAYDPQRLQRSILLEREKQNTIMIAFSAGQELKEHQAACDVLVIPLEGSADFMLGQTRQRLQVGQVYTIPANEPHALKAVTNFKMILIK